MSKTAFLARAFTIACLMPLYAQGAESAPALPLAEPLPAQPAAPLFHERLKAEAQRRASQPYEPRALPPEHPLRQLSYDDYHAIELRREAQLWSDQNREFRIGRLHPGFIYPTQVRLNILDEGKVQPIAFSNYLYNYGNESARVSRVPAEGYSGFRVLNRLNQPDKWDEVLVFQGGSYFRAVGQDNWYGLSARGLAVNTAQPSGEEFPEFTQFWIEEPAPGQDTLVLHGLLESASLTGAYTFQVVPGVRTVMEVQATLYPRRDIETFGIAPLTSMFYLAPANRARFQDFRPAVHDSEGLAIMQANGERVWRPLANPRSLQISSFVNKSILGFGLLQRSRDFEDYQDIGARYQLRPSAWIEPIGDWGEGHVELVEIPTDSEFHDNIVAYWNPEGTLTAGEPYSFRYRIHWGDRAPYENFPGRVVDTLYGLSVRDRNIHEFAVDYAADEYPADLEAVATLSAGRLLEVQGVRVEATGRYRVLIKFDPEGEDLIEFRLALNSNGQHWGETWLYRWTE